MNNELIERYVYDVVRRLPEKQRQDIKDELLTLIEDMLEEYTDNGKSEKENVESVLRTLGSPAILADKYRGGKEYLIGGEYYSTYIQVLKIVLACVAVGMLIATFVSMCVKGIDPAMEVNGWINMMEEGIVNIAAIPGACIQAFGILTLVFAIMERNHVKLQDKGDWKLEELPLIPEKKAMISRSESVVSIVFTVLVMIMFICVPELMGAWLKSSDGVVVAVPAFNMAVWNTTLPLLLISMLANLIDELVKLLKGRYCLSVLWTNIVTCVINIIVAAKMLLTSNVWNPNFVSQIAQLTGETIPEIGDVAGPSVVIGAGGELQVLNIIFVIVILASVLEIGTTIFRTLVYGLKKTN
ncbi:MAG: hypothetical protein IJW63_04260 [Lachnospiraceae bacterium]|nr:hypothetical protein [Lachnospiraceae bacterium]